VIAVDAPRFVENLPPLGARIDLDLELVGGEFELREIEFVADVDERVSILRDQHPLAVGGEIEAVDFFQERVFFALVEIEMLQAGFVGSEAIEAGGLEIENLSGLAGL